MQTYTKLLTIGGLVVTVIFGWVARLDALAQQATTVAAATTAARATTQHAPFARTTAHVSTQAVAFAAPTPSVPVEMTQAELAQMVGGGFWSALRDVAIWVVEAAFVAAAVAGIDWLCSQPNVTCS